MPMAQRWNQEGEDDVGESQKEFGGFGPGMALRMRQLRVEAQSQLIDAQKTLAHATAKNARYMLVATVACAVSSAITVIAVLYGLLVVLPRVPH